ncbi:MAG TPA: hypothetical protein VFS40_02005 [Gemmatimonadales bacterium]|nr:hypothetical protein [Gemmatimonadales bacterium]
MVTGRRGSSSLGCLFTLLIFVTVLYYGINIGEVYFRYYQLVDEMRVQARLAPGLADDVIRRRLEDKIDRLDLPPEAARLTIRRSARDRAITIATRYAETVELPFFQHTFILRPRVSEPL